MLIFAAECVTDLGAHILFANLTANYICRKMQILASAVLLFVFFLCWMLILSAELQTAVTVKDY